MAAKLEECSKCGSWIEKSAMFLHKLHCRGRKPSIERK